MAEPFIPQFPPTRWSVVLAAAGSGEESRTALEEWCRLYWFPLYAFARQRGWSPEDAEDETQEFLARVASGGILSTVTRERGRLRTWLLAAFQRDLIDTRRRQLRQKRGGGVRFVSIDSADAELRLASLTSARGPEDDYDRAFALANLEAAAARLEDEYTQRGRASLFQTLRPFLDPAADPDGPAAAAAAGLEANALRQAVFRLRQRFRVLFREVIAETLASGDESLIEEELAALRKALHG